LIGARGERQLTEDSVAGIVEGVLQANPRLRYEAAIAEPGPTVPGSSSSSASPSANLAANSLRRLPTAAR
jgi:hypothetical protein